MKKCFFLIAVALMAFTACYDKELEELDKEIADMNATEVASLVKQADNVTSSLDDLNSLSSEIKEYIGSLKETSESLQNELQKVTEEFNGVKTALQSEISQNNKEILSKLEMAQSALDGQKSNVDSAIKVLEDKNKEIDAKINDLKSYADGKYAEKSWVEGTFATADDQTRLYDEVVGVKAMIETLQANLDSAAIEINRMINEKVLTMTSSLDGKLQSEVQKLSGLISGAFAAAQSEITSAYGQAIKAAIDSCENKIKKWVGTELSKYYTVSEAEAQVAAFQAILGNVPAGENLQGEIDSLYAAIGRAKSDIIETYKDYLGRAITESEGRMEGIIDSKITELTTNVINPLAERVSTLETKIADLTSKLGKLESRIQSVEQQYSSINSSIEQLKNLQTSLESYVGELKKNLEKADSTNLSNLNRQISSLSSLSTDIKKKIEDLTAYVGNLPKGQTSMADWVSTSLSTLEKEFDSYYTISQINGMVQEINSSIETTLGTHAKSIKDLGTKITDDISKLEKSIKSWVNSELSGYVKSADLTSRIDSVKTVVDTLFTRGDRALSERINTLSDALNQAKSTITSNYQKYITEAIQKGGFLNDTISTAIAGINARIKNINSDISTLQNEAKDLKERMKNAEGRLDRYEKQIDSLDNKLKSFIDGYEESTLAEELKKIKDQIDTCSKHISFNSDSLKNLVTYVNGELAEKIASLLDLESNLSQAQKDIEALKKFVGSHGEGETLTSIINAMKAQLDTCLKTAELKDLKSKISEISGMASKVLKLETDLNAAKTEMGAISTFLNGLEKKGTLDSLLALIENKISKLDKAADSTSKSFDQAIKDIQDKIKYFSGQIDTLTEAVITRSISSITYVPLNNNGGTSFTKTAGKNEYKVYFDFVVRPSELTSILAANSGCVMRYIDTPTKAAGDIGTAFPNQVRSVTGEGLLRISVTVTDVTPYKNGISAALFINIKKSEAQPVNFTSRFIPVKVPSDVETVTLDPSELTFKWEGESKRVGVTPQNNSYQVTYTPEWISTSNKSNTGVTFSAGKNNASNSRSGYVVLKINGEERYLKVIQEARPEQTFKKFDPESGSTYGQGFFTADYIKVTTSDGKTDWTIDTDNTSSWIYTRKSGDSIFIFLLPNGTGSTRKGIITLKSFSGNTTYEYVLYQP